jgi:hypothetical protein
MRVYIGPYSKDSSEDREIDIHIDQHDTWGMDHTLALIIHPMLLQLKETKQGSPFVDDEDVPEHLRSTNAPPKEHEWDTDDLFHDRWKWVLDEMIWAFEHKKNDDWMDPFYEKLDYESIREIEHRMWNGFRLFGKYYGSLWD